MNNINSFKTHKGEVVTGKRFIKACKEVAKDARELAYKIREEDEYASHVKETIKDDILQKSLASADLIEKGQINNFTIWQRVNQKLTGECIALLP